MLVVVLAFSWFSFPSQSLPERRAKLAENLGPPFGGYPPGGPKTLLPHRASVRDETSCPISDEVAGPRFQFFSRAKNLQSVPAKFAPPLTNAAAVLRSPTLGRV